MAYAQFGGRVAGVGGAYGGAAAQPYPRGNSFYGGQPVAAGAGYGQPIQAGGMMGMPRVAGQGAVTAGAAIRRPGQVGVPQMGVAGQPASARPGVAGRPTAYAGYGAGAPQAAPQAAPIIRGSPQAAPITTPANPQLIATITKLMDDRQELKKQIVKAFKKVAGTGRTIDISGLIKLRRELSLKLQIPDSLFGSIEDEYVRFDFDGSGFLEANEVYKLVKWHLYDFLQSAGGNQSSIAMKSLQSAGYTTTKELGAGNQAVLKLACDRYGNQRCIKCFKKSAMANSGVLSDMQEEFETMQLLSCKSIARTFEIFQDAQFVYMVNEVYWGGDLTKVESNAMAKGVPITEDWWRGIFRQCFEALQFMHQQAMMHCDIKEPNMMLRNENYDAPQVVLIDFGVSKAMTAKDTGSVSGTPGYMPPETMNQGKWYPGGDIFSMGVTMMQLLTHKIPDEDKARQGIMIGIFLEGCRDIDGVKMAVNTRQPPFALMPAQWPGLKQITMRCLEKNLRSRPKAPTVLKDPWFGVAVEQDIAVEKAMMPSHPMATVGITEEMMQAPLAATQAINVGQGGGVYGVRR